MKSSYPKKSTERKKIHENLRNEENYLHNNTVLRIGEGTLLPERRSQIKSEENDGPVTIKDMQG